MTVILTDTSQLDSFCLQEEKHRLIYIHGYFGSAPKIEGFERSLLLSSTIHFSALENNRDFWSFFRFSPRFFQEPWKPLVFKMPQKKQVKPHQWPGAEWCWNGHGMMLSRPPALDLFLRFIWSFLPRQIKLKYIWDSEWGNSPHTL